MSILSARKPYLHFNFFLCLILLGITLQVPLSYSALRTPFTHYAEQQDIATVLTQFARTQGYSAFFTPKVTGDLSGKFQAVPPITFLQGINSAFGVRWYSLDKTLYFYHESESQRAFLSPHSMSVERMFTMLRQANVFSPELMPTVRPDSGVITINGPEGYIKQITIAANSFEQSQMSNMVMQVFPLKFAWADDITVNSNQQTITVPGIASILRSMVIGNIGSPRTVTQNSASVGGLMGKGLASLGKEDSKEPSVSSSSSSSSPPTSISAVNIMADARVNAVIINDAAYRMPYYEKVIKDLDKPVELVEIHAAIVDINTDFTRDFGVNFQYASSNHKDWRSTGDIGGAANLFPTDLIPGATSGGLGITTIYSDGFSDFIARVEALENTGDGRVLGRPSVLTVDNIQASLENTTTYYVKLEGKEEVDLFEVEAGTTLRVTPHIIKDEYGKTFIKLAVHVEDMQQNSDSIVDPSTGVPPIKQTKINTQAIVTEGQSLLIGGYYYEQQVDSETGVPVLMSIPILGHLFKSSNTQTKRMERLILLTPRVINHDAKHTMPTHVDEPSFHRSPTQSNYENRIPQETGSGCSKKSSVQNPQNQSKNVNGNI